MPETVQEPALEEKGMSRARLQYCKIEGIKSKHTGIPKWVVPPGYTKTEWAFHDLGYEMETENPGHIKRMCEANPHWKPVMKS